MGLEGLPAARRPVRAGARAGASHRHSCSASAAGHPAGWEP